MSKTNVTPSQATQSVPASNDIPVSVASKPAFNYAAAAARSSSSGRPGSGPPNPAIPNPPPSFASAVVAIPSPLASGPSSTKPPSRAPDAAVVPPRPTNGSSTVKTPAPAPERKSSIIAAKGHNIKPSASHISFGSLADIPAKSDTTSMLSSSPANPPILSRRDAPPVFGSVSTDPAKKALDPPSLVTPTTSKTSVTTSTPGPATKVEKKKIDFQSFFMSGGESLSHPTPPPASSGSSPSPSISYRGDPTQNRRNPNGFDPVNSIPSAAPPLSPRPAHVGVSNGPNGGGSFHSPLSGASRAFTPGQGHPPMSQPPQSQTHHYPPGAGHWQGGQAPNSPHFVPGNPPLNANMSNYPHPHTSMVGSHGNQQQFLQKPQAFQHRSGGGGQSGGAASPMYPPNSRSNLHHSQRGGMTGPPSPRLPPGNAPNGAPSPGYQHAPPGPGMPTPYWPQGPYPSSGPSPYPPYGYNPNVMPTYPHPGNFPPPPHGQHPSPQLSNQTGPLVSSQSGPPSSTSGPPPPNAPRTHPPPAVPSPIPSSPVPASATYASPYPPSALYSPGASHSRGPSLSYNAPTFNPSAVSPDFKPHTPNAAAPAFQPRRSAAVAIKKPPVTPISSVLEEGDKPLESMQGSQLSKDRPGTSSSNVDNSNKAATDSADSKAHAEVSKVALAEERQGVSEKGEAEKKEKELNEKKVAEEAADKKRLDDERRVAEEVETKRKVQEHERLERDAKAKLEKEAKEKAERGVQEKAEREAKENTERQAQEKAEREAKEKAERETRQKAELDNKEKQAMAPLTEKTPTLDQVVDQPVQDLANPGVKESAPATSATPEADSARHDTRREPPSGQSEAKSTDQTSAVKPDPAAASSSPEPASLSGLPLKPVNGVCLPPSTSKSRPTPIDVTAIPQHKRATSTSSDTLTPALPSALSSARKIEDLGQVSYPENIQSPRSELNADATPGKFRYDRAFLLQFMEVCKGKPVQLPDLDSIGMVDSHSTGVNPMSRTQSTGGQRRNTGQLPPSNRGPSGSLTPSGGSMSMMGPASMPNRAGSGASMPMFATGTSRTSEERFHQSTRPTLGAMPIGSGLMLPGRPTGQMSRTPSSNALPSMMTNGARDTSRRSGRGSRRDGGANPPTSNSAHNLNLNRGMPLQQMFSVEMVQPLQPSANSWAASRSTQLEEDSPQMVNRKVKALLNKLTLDKFESISDQVISWANKSEKEHDGRILRQVIALIFEKATDEAHWSEMYAKLCRKLMEKLSPEVKDENVLDGNGNKVHGGHLFRKYLLNRCQEDYERGWSKRDELAAAAAGKAADDAVKQAANEKSRAEAEAEGKEAPSKEAEILSDEYYAAQKAKRQGLGLVRFIGELFKLNMLTERIMHECVKKLLSNIDTPEEEDIESLCRFMMTVGELLDHEKALSHMNVYFSRMATMATNLNLSSRARFMIQDVIDTRKNRWVGRNVAAGPKLISQIHEEAAQAAAEQSRQSQANKTMGKMNDLSRGGSRGGRNRDQMGGPTGDGWLSVGGSVPPPRPSKAGDLTQFGKLRDTSSSGRPTFGPSNVFANKGKLKDGKAATDREPAVAVASNPFAALGGDTGEGNNPGLSRKPSVPEMAPAGRPRLNLAPRTLPLPGQGSPAEADAADKQKLLTETADSQEEADITDEAANRLVRNRVDEFFNVRSIPEAVESFSSLVKPRHHELLRSLVEKVLDRKAADVALTASLFQKLSNGTVVRAVFLKAFEPVVEQLDDTAVDARYAYEYCAKLLKASRLSDADVKQLAQKMDTEDLEVASKRLVDAFVSAKVE